MMELRYVHCIAFYIVALEVLCIYCVSSKEVWKLNFRQYGEMEMAQPGRNSDVEKVRREDKRWRKSEESRCRCAKR